VDTIARFGGDEFAVLMEQVEHADDIAKVVEKLVRALDQPFVLEGHETIVTTSVGISVFPDDGSDVTTLLKNADAALYVAKEGGRNTYRYYRAEMTRDALNRLNIERELRLALETNQLEVWYQPQIDLESGEAVGAEALVRWRHPQRGIVPPNEFIPLAEETGLIVQLGEQVLKIACQQLYDWVESGIFSGKVAVNVAGLQIERGDIVASVQDVLQQTRLAPQLLELEITEGFIMGDAEYALRVLAELKQLGVTTSIDDFGTGYSSLSYLKRIPIDNLKVDQSFVRDLPDDLEDAAITRAVIALAKSLGYKVIAEGVESEAQRAFLLQEQCSHAQGYLFARPMPADEFECWLKRTGQ
jgi:predicted signal transduction protein with EAL and GGDEF domain